MRSFPDLRIRLKKTLPLCAAALFFIFFCTLHILLPGDEMKKAKWKSYVGFLAITEAVGGLAGFLTRKGVKAFKSVPKSSLTPPDTVFPIVWSALFALMGIGAARVYQAPPSTERTRSLILFFLQLAVNFGWSLLFFNLQAFGFAFLWLILLWILILLMILSFRKVDKAAAWLQIPYLLWVGFAGYLNCITWLLNR